jgi:phosphoserine aminotransferase
MSNNKPNYKPKNPNFSSGPTSKRPNWSLEQLEHAVLGRSHRAEECKIRLNEVIEKSKKILGLPKDYVLGIMPGSDTGALEASLWCLLGERGVDVLAWDNFGKDWVIDVVDQLKIQDFNVYQAEYGELPDLTKVDFIRDVIFTWNGTTAGVKVPNGNWIPSDRKGLTICDATSAIFAMPIDYDKCDVLTWSWQKVLGGEAAHGMLALSPRAVKRLESYQPSWPIPKAFRIAEKKKFKANIFEGDTINTPSMLCVEDAIDTLLWVESIGGLDSLFERSNTSFEYIANWIERTSWIEFISHKKETCSNTGITFKITEDWFTKIDVSQQREVMKKITSLLSIENVANDINGYPKAPPSFRVWGGGTVESSDIRALLPWIEWAYEEVKLQYNK